MPEVLSTHEVAHTVAHGHHAHHAAGTRVLLEIAEAVVLAVVAVATAWSGYQAARWDGHQSQLYGLASKEHTLANRASTLGGQQLLYDTTTFSFWLQAKTSGNVEAEKQFQRRFRPEFRPAYVAWLATEPFTNPNAPPGPTRMPQYHNAQLELAQKHEEAGDVAFAQGTKARENGERFLRNTVLLATVLFLTAVAQRFQVFRVRLGLLAVSGVLLAIALVYVFTYPSA
jgi:hypothetical protein